MLEGYLKATDEALIYEARIARMEKEKYERDDRLFEMYVEASDQCEKFAQEAIRYARQVEKIREELDR